MSADPVKSTLERAGLDRGRGLAALAVSIGLIGLAALGEQPRLALRWSRADIAAGEAWRLATGHLVHLDLEHALLNVAGLLLVWALFSRVFTAGQWALTLLAGVVAIDLGLWVVNVDLQWYVGASGLLHTAMAAGIVRQMLARDVVAWGLGALGVGKLLFEHFSGAMPFTASGALVVTDAHLYGAVAGMICGVMRRPGRVGSPQPTRAAARR
jgi:rhomboid family GlyGly-CTERM serine protease